MNQSEGMRINKFLSAAGVCSRREADRLIAAGKVTVAGETAELGTLVSAGMEVKVNGRRVGAVEELASKISRLAWSARRRTTTARRILWS